jgi:cyclin-D1-binding protein 1
MILHKFHSLLRCIATLQKRIQLDLISNTSPSRKEPDPKTLDILLAHSTNLLAACDALASSLYSPQDKSTLTTELGSLLDEIRSIKEIVMPLTIRIEGTGTNIEEKMAALNIQKQNDKPERDVRAWFETCFAQVSRISDSISSELRDSTTVTSDATP